VSPSMRGGIFFLALHALSALLLSCPVSEAMASPAVRPASLETLFSTLRNIASLRQAKALVEWDQLVMMSHADATSKARGGHLAALAGVIHEKSTAGELGDAIAAAERDLAKGGADARDMAAVRDARRDFDMETKISSELATRKAALSAEAYSTWNKARTASDFSMFEETLSRCFAVAAEVAEARADGRPIYDTCLDEFERGMPAERIAGIFDEVKAALQPLIQQVLQSEHKPSEAPLSTPTGVDSFDLKAQETLNKDIVKSLGFNFDQGRVDVSVHPFTTSFSPADVRITSRFNDKEWYQGLAGSVHECGHAMYESQLRDTGLPVDQALSMGVHESQSLFWERHIGLSRPFWKWCGPKVRDALGVVGDDEELYRAVNHVKQGFIRVEADELTYPMHVILRYTLERKLMSGEMTVAELPEAWNRGMEELLGVEVPDDAKGCLQDVHWSALAIGYFPTYLLGAMMAAQLSHYIRQDAEFRAAHGDVDELIAAGNFAPFKEWLRVHIHDNGSLHDSMDTLLQAEFGEPLMPKYFISYLQDKYADIYQLA